MSIIRKVYYKIIFHPQTSETTIYYDPKTGILRDSVKCSSMQYFASPAVMVRKNKRALKNIKLTANNK